MTPAPPWGPGPSSDGPLPARADVVVVGGGLPGLVAATELAEAGVDVLLVEAAPQLGGGASGRAPGLAYVGIVEHAWRLAASLGDPDAAALYRFSRASVRRLRERVAVVPTGVGWTCTETEREPEELVRSAEALARLGHPVTWLERDAFAERAGMAAVSPALWMPDEGVFDPAAAVTALAGALSAAGGSWRTGQRVRRVGPDADAYRVDTDDGSVRAEIVVLAAEAGLRGLDQLFDDALTPVREQAVALHDPTGPTVGVRAGFGWTTAVRGEDGRLIVSGCRWASPHLEEGERDASVLHPQVQERLRATAERFFPSAGEVHARWAWITSHACDGLPLVGPMPGDPRRIACCGFGGGEAALGVEAAHAVVEGILTGRAPQLPRRFDPGRLLA